MEYKYNYGKVIRNCCCGTTIYVLTESNKAYSFEISDENISVSDGTLKSKKSLKKTEYPIN